MTDNCILLLVTVVTHCKVDWPTAQTCVRTVVALLTLCPHSGYDVDIHLYSGQCVDRF